MLLIVDNETIGRMLGHIDIIGKIPKDSRVVAHRLPIAEHVFQSHVEKWKLITIDLAMEDDGEIIEGVDWPDGIPRNSTWTGFALHRRWASRCAAEFCLLTRQPQNVVTRLYDHVFANAERRPDLLYWRSHKKVAQSLSERYAGLVR